MTTRDYQIPGIDPKGIMMAFAQYGFRKTSMEDIARASDLSRQSIYKKFGSKESCYEQVLLAYMAGVYTELFRILEEASGAPLFAYLRIGVDHILFGYDHLLFVLGLCLLVRRSQLLLTVTAFTVAHSITLGLSTLAGLTLPGPPVEAVIALSLILLACLSPGAAVIWSIRFAQRHGCTVHEVTAALDDGPILGQARLEIAASDTPASLAARVLRLEHRLYPDVLRRFASGDRSRCDLG